VILKLRNKPLPLFESHIRYECERVDMQMSIVLTCVESPVGVTLKLGK